jgi:UDP-N-acetylglucosamine 4,6-dehydratase
MMGREIFVPKIPSANIVDLVKAFGRPWHTVGIRPGEKLHETLVTQDEIRYLHEHSKYYVILPTLRADDPVRSTPYASDSNTQWLTVDDLRRTLNEGENET